MCDIGPCKAFSHRMTDLTGSKVHEKLNWAQKQLHSFPGSGLVQLVGDEIDFGITNAGLKSAHVCSTRTDLSLPWTLYITVCLLCERRSD